MRNSQVISFLSFNAEDINKVEELLREGDKIPIVEEIQDEFNNLGLIEILIRRGLRISLRNFLKILQDFDLQIISKIFRLIPEEELEFYLTECNEQEILHYASILSEVLDHTKRIHIIFCDILINNAVTKEDYISNINSAIYQENIAKILLQQLDYLLENGADQEDLNIIFNTISTIWGSIQKFYSNSDKLDEFLGRVRSNINSTKNWKIIREEFHKRD